MATFHLDVMTPEKKFFSGDVEALTVRDRNGELTVLAGHAHMIVALEIGSIKILQNGVWQEAFSSEGFLEVLSTGVVVYAQSCELPQDIDVARAKQAADRAEERLRQHMSQIEYHSAKISLARAMARLRVSARRSLR